MAINPNLILQAGRVAPSNIGQSFNTLLSSIGKQDAIKQNRIDAPIQSQLFQQRAAQGEQTIEAEKQKQRITSVAQGAAELAPFLESNDIEGALSSLSQRRARLEADGKPTNDTDEMIAMIQSGNVDLAKQRTNQAVQVGHKLGVFNRSFAGQTPRQRELEQFANLPEGTPEEIKFKKQFGTAIGAIAKAPTLEQKLDFEGKKKRVIGDIGIEQKLEELKRIEKETEDKKTAIELRKVNIDETKIKNLEARQLAIDKKNATKKEASNAVAVVEDLLKGDNFSHAFGKFNNFPPEGLRTQANIDARAQVNQIIGLISLEAREKLKGQGTITEGETKTLAQAATLLENPLISDRLARKEIRRVRGVFEDVEDRNQLKRETIQNQLQQNQSDVKTLSDEDLFN